MATATLEKTGFHPYTASGTRCKDSPLDFFPDVYDEDAPVEVPSEIKALCARCPFRVGCQEWATKNDEYGFWAGTSRFQRHQLSRTTHRVKCPSCESEAVIVSGRVEICTSCAQSWMI